MKIWKQGGKLLKNVWDKLGFHKIFRINVGGQKIQMRICKDFYSIIFSLPSSTKGWKVSGL